MKHINYIWLLLIALSLTTLDIHAQWAPIDPLPTARAYAASAYYNGKIYVIGGVYRETIQAYKTVEAYDPSEGTWDASLPDFPIPVRHAQAHVVRDTLYAIGRKDKSSDPETIYAFNPQSREWRLKCQLPDETETVILSSVSEDSIYIIAANQLYPFFYLYVFDPVSGQWSEKRDLPFPFFDLYRSFHFLDLEIINRELYIFFEKTDWNLNYKVHVKVLDLETQIWSDGMPLDGEWSGFKTATLDQKIYFFGSKGKGDEANLETWTYDPDTDAWSDTGMSFSGELSRFTHVVAPDQKGRASIYVIGGTTESLWGGYDPPYVNGHAMRFTPEKETDWQYMAPMPTPRTMAASAVVDGKAYVIGGVTSRTGMATNIVEAYDMETDTWETDIAPLPKPLCNASAEGYYSAAGTVIFVAGGSASPGGPGQNTLFAYDPAKNMWTKMADANRSLSGICLVRHLTKSQLFAIGGFDSNGTITDSVSIYNISEDSWEAFHPLQHPRAYASGVCTFPYGERIMVFGGLGNDGPLSSSEYTGGFDPWQGGPEMPHALYWHGAGVYRGDPITWRSDAYFFGGFKADDEPQKDILHFDWRTNEWTKIDANFPEFTCPFATSFRNEYSSGGPIMNLYAIGGAKPDFWYGGDGPLVSGVNMRYRIPLYQTTSTANGSMQNKIRLIGNYPNPSAIQTVITFELTGASEVSIEILEPSGHLVGKALNGHLDAGKHEITCDISQLPAGIYFYQLKTEYGMASRKMIVQ